MSNLLQQIAELSSDKSIPGLTSQDRLRMINGLVTEAVAKQYERIRKLTEAISATRAWAGTSQILESETLEKGGSLPPPGAPYHVSGVTVEVQTVTLVDAEGNQQTFKWGLDRQLSGCVRVAGNCSGAPDATLQR